MRTTNAGMPGLNSPHSVCIIPAFNPSGQLLHLVTELRASGLQHLVIVDDGSAPAPVAVFEALPHEPGIHVLRHAVNLGKGAALKTGLNFAFCQYPGACVFVTADADGQHAAADIVHLAAEGLAHPDALTLGVRSFQEGVPFRSRLGNELTRKMVHWFVGCRLADTQTGLRAIPRGLVPLLLRIPASGYEFELDMIVAARHSARSIREVAIQTIYIDGNRSSHFNPVLDSMKIYFVLMRFSAVAVLTALLDNSIFLAAYSLTSGILFSQIVARLVAMAFNYLAARRAVFHARGSHAGTFGKYVLLVAANATISYALIHLIMRYTGIHVFWSKLAAESLLFLANFALQRDFVFSGSRRQAALETATNWDRYYKHVPATAHLTRRYTARVLDSILSRFPEGQPRNIVEIGGANSCFADRILARWRPNEYRALDTNEYGLHLLRRRYPSPSPVTTENANVLSIPPRAASADVVFSIGLIEHFLPDDTRRAVESHFELVRDGGLVIISFPTPTPLYRIARAICEGLGAWKFPDERPLDPGEVLRAVGERGSVLFRKTLWPLVFTQHIVVVRASHASFAGVPGIEREAET